MPGLQRARYPVDLAPLERSCRTMKLSMAGGPGAGVLLALLSVDRRARRSRRAERRADPGVPQAGGTAAAAARTGAGGVDERYLLADRRRVPGSGRSGDEDRAERGREGLDRRRIEIYEDDVRLGDPRLAAVRVSLPSDISFDSYAGALRSLLGPALPDGTEVVRSQAMVDALFEYPIRSDRSRFSIDPALSAAGSAGADRPAIRDAGRRRARPRVPRRSRARPARSALVPGRAAVRRRGVRHILTAPIICCSCSAW